MKNKIYLISISTACLLLAGLAYAYSRISAPPTRHGNNSVTLLGYSPSMSYEDALALAESQDEDGLIEGYEKGVNKYSPSWKTLRIDTSDKSRKAMEKAMTLPCDSMEVNFGSTGASILDYSLKFDSASNGRDLERQHVTLIHDIKSWAPDAVEFRPDTEAGKELRFGIDLNEGRDDSMTISLKTDKATGVSIIYISF